MKFLTPILTVLLVMFLFMSCEKELIIEDVTDEITSLQPELLNKKQPQQRPFTARFVSMPSSSGPNPAVCGTGFPVLALSQTGTGNATHMGNISVVLNSCVDIGPTLATPPGPPIVVGASIVITAANGDELYLSGDGNQGSPFDIDGGTGRFEDASGEVTGTFVPIGFDPVTGRPNKFASTLRGHIIY